MSEYPNSGILNRNKYKKAGSNAPDATGKCVSTCKHCKQETEFEIAGWIREMSGRKFTTLRFTERGEAEAKRTAARAAKSGLPTEGAATAPGPEADAPPADQTEDNIPF